MQALARVCVVGTKHRDGTGSCVGTEPAHARVPLRNRVSAYSCSCTYLGVTHFLWPRQVCWWGQRCGVHRHGGLHRHGGQRYRHGIHWERGDWQFWVLVHRCGTCDHVGHIGICIALHRRIQERPSRQHRPIIRLVWLAVVAAGAIEIDYDNVRFTLPSSRWAASSACVLWDTGAALGHAAGTVSVGVGSTNAVGGKVLLSAGT